MKAFEATAIRCASVRDSFSSYLDGAINGREMLAVAGHLESCPECATDFEVVTVSPLELKSLEDPDYEEEEEEEEVEDGDY